MRTSAITFPQGPWLLAINTKPATGRRQHKVGYTRNSRDQSSPSQPILSGPNYKQKRNRKLCQSQLPIYIYGVYICDRERDTLWALSGSYNRQAIAVARFFWTARAHRTCVGNLSPIMRVTFSAVNSRCQSNTLAGHDTRLISFYLFLPAFAYLIHRKQNKTTFYGMQFFSLNFVLEVVFFFKQ